MICSCATSRVVDKYTGNTIAPNDTQFLFLFSKIYKLLGTVRKICFPSPDLVRMYTVDDDEEKEEEEDEVAGDEASDDVVVPVLV